MQATTATARSNTLTALDRTSAARPVPEKSFPCCTASQGLVPPAPAAGGDYPGYPLVAGRQVALLWFFVGLPLCIALAWWWSRRLPEPIAARSRRRFTHEDD